jgi:MtN3 and saliva related transmembrane protein
MITEFIGWSASVILLITIIKQVRKQWRTGTNEGVSKWLFVGQVASSVGFTVYSALTGNMVFIVTNVFLLLSNIAGVYIYFRNREKIGKEGEEDDESVLGRTDYSRSVELNRGKARGEKI